MRERGKEWESLSSLREWGCLAEFPGGLAKPEPCVSGTLLLARYPSEMSMHLPQVSTHNVWTEHVCVGTNSL